MALEYIRIDDRLIHGQVVVGRESTPLLVPSELTDDRQNIQPGENVLLIIEDDAKFGRILLDLAHDRGFKAVVSATGSGALSLVRLARVGEDRD